MMIGKAFTRAATLATRRTDVNYRNHKIIDRTPKSSSMFRGEYGRQAKRYEIMCLHPGKVLEVDFFKTQWGAQRHIDKTLDKGGAA